MSFQAIVHAAALRPGARVCVCDLDQTANTPASAPVAGDLISLRIGTCCPQLASGVVERCDETGELVVRIGRDDWSLCRSDTGGVSIPGLVADDWLVVGAERV